VIETLTMAPAVALRDVTAADTEFLVAVYASTRADELAVVPWDDAAKGAFIRMQFAAQDSYWRAQKPGAQFAVVTVGDEPAGRLYVDRLPAEIRIVDIALLPAYRGRGIGTSLLCDVLAEGRRAQLPVTIHVEHFNRARTLYDRLGFTQISTTGVYDLLELRPATALDPPSQGALSHG
jgi:ribosomal protein S18 acetylase RimI-like enzyme